MITLKNLTKVYETVNYNVIALSDINYQLDKGEVVVLLGKSGSGKSTLLNILGGLEAPTVGEVKVGGEALYEVSENKRAAIRNRQLGFVYQFHHLLPEFTAIENVAMPLLLGKEDIAIAQKKSTQILQAVGLGERLKHKPAQLSGGERQRVAIARALVTRPACVLMDEPTGNLDRNTASDVQQLMGQLNQELNTSFVIVTHDPELAHRMDRVLELKSGGLYRVD